MINEYLLKHGKTLIAAVYLMAKMVSQEVTSAMTSPGALRQATVFSTSFLYNMGITWIINV